MCLSEHCKGENVKKKSKVKAKVCDVIGLGLPVAEIVHPTVYFNHLAAVATWKAKHKIILLGTNRMKITSAREHITAQALKMGCTHLLFLDSDHIVPCNMLDLLMESKDAAMVSGLICKKKPPYEQVAFIYDKRKRLEPCMTDVMGKIYSVDVCAMGCTLINLAKLQLLGKPYFSDGHFRHDINLCLKFKNELGAKVLVDTRIQIGHIGEPEIIYPNNAQLLRERFDETTIPIQYPHPDV